MATRKHVLIFDDIGYSVRYKARPFDDDLFSFSYYLQFDEIVDILLSKSELDLFIGNNTRRTFAVSEKKIQVGIDYVKNYTLNKKNSY